MKLDSSLNTETNCTLKETSFSIKASPIAFDILSNKLYSDPILAIVRELLCNAYDSHVVAGTIDTPIDVIFPNNLENTFTIRDYGTGLSKESIYELYTTFFGSNKSDSNDLTGGFGLGSKTPFAYTTSFSVTSYYNGVESKYLVTKKDGYPTIYEISDTPTTEPNGLKVVIPVSKDNYDTGKFFTAFQNYIYYIPEINVNSNAEYYKGIKVYQKDNITCYKTKYTYKNECKVFIKQGQNVYGVSTNKYIGYETLDIFSDINRYLDVVIEVPIGTIGITPNREQLSVEDKDFHTVANILTKCINTFITNFEDLIEVLVKSSISGTQNLITKFYTKKYLNGTPLGLISVSGDICVRVPEQYLFDSYILEDEEDGTVSSNFYYRVFHCNDKENIIILANSRNVRTNARKVQNVIRNYSNELKDKVFYIFYVDDTVNAIDKYNYYASTKTSALQVVRNLYNYIWYMNNIPNYSCNVTCMSMSKFFRKYPNNKAKRAKKKEVDLEDVNIICSDFRFFNNFGKIFSGKDSFCVKYIQETLATKDSAILLFEDDGETIENVGNYHRILHKVLNLDGQYSKVIEYFKDNYNMDCTKKPINLITIAKSNKKYFKDYSTMTVSQLKDLVRSIDFTVTNKTCSLESSKMYNFSETINEFIERTVPEKDTHIWLKSRFKKKLDLIRKLKDRYLNNYIESTYNSDIIDFIGKDAKQVKNVPNIPEATCNSIHKVYNSICGVFNTKSYKKHRNTLLKQLRSNHAVF